MKRVFDIEAYNDEQKIRELWEAANIDKLTKLYNCYGMESWISEQLNFQASNNTSALLIIDVDNFKSVNDSYGHMFGDALLVEIAKIIIEIFDEEYFCGRIGGDEYQIFASNVIDKAEVKSKANKLCQKVREANEKLNSSIEVSLSIGIVFAKGDDNSYSDLYRKADLALYQAKVMGKDLYRVYQDDSPIIMKYNKQRDHAKVEYVEQIGESGFSIPKLLLDQVYNIIENNDDPKTTIQLVSKAIVDTFDVTRAYASCYTKDESHIGKSYFYAQNDNYNIQPNIAFSGKEYEKKYFNKDSIFFCTNIDETMEPIRSELKRMGVKTMLQVLIHKNGKIIGTLGVNNCGYKRLWLRSEIEVFHTIAMLLTNHIYRLQQEIEQNNVIIDK